MFIKNRSVHRAKRARDGSNAEWGDAWTRALAVVCLRTRAFSKSAIYISWLHELKEWPRSGFLNMAAGRPRAVIQSRFFWLDQTVALFSAVCRPRERETVISFVFSYSRFPLHLAPSLTVHLREKCWIDLSSLFAKTRNNICLTTFNHFFLVSWIIQKTTVI